MRSKSAIAAVLLMALVGPRTAGVSGPSGFSGMQGWTIIAVTQVEDDFEGCDFDKPIKFTNGLVLSCSTFGYTYSFMPRAVIFASSSKFQGTEFYSVKALIGDRLYDMQPILKK